MKHYPATIVNLIEKISRLPGIGEKTAERLALHLLHAQRGSRGVGPGHFGSQGTGRIVRKMLRPERWPHMRHLRRSPAKRKPFVCGRAAG